MALLGGKPIRASAAILAILLVTAAGCSFQDRLSGLVVEAKSLAGLESQRGEELALGENQREVYGMVTAVVGNEITLALGDLSQGKNGLQENSGEGQNLAPVIRDDSGADTNAGRSNGSGGGKDGRIPDAAGGNMMPGGAPGETAGGMSGGTPHDSAAGKGEGAGSEQKSGGMRGVSLELTGEEVTYQVPPPIPVEYSVGNQNLTLSFTRIAEDNVLRLILQMMEDGTESIVRIQIVG